MNIEKIELQFYSVELLWLGKILSGEGVKKFQNLSDVFYGRPLISVPLN